MAFGFYDPNNPANHKGSPMSAYASNLPEIGSAKAQPVEEIPALLCDISVELANLQDTVASLSIKLTPALRPEGAISGEGINDPAPLTTFGKTLQDYRISLINVRRTVQDLTDRLAI